MAGRPAEPIARSHQLQCRQRGIGHAVPPMRRQPAVRVVDQGQPQQRGFDRAGRTERMAGHRLGGTGQHVGPEHGMDGTRLHRVVVSGTGPMQVQIVDLRWRKAGARQGLPHRLLGTLAFRLGRGDMVGIRALAPARQPDRSGFERQHEQRGALTQIDAGAVSGEWVGARGGHRFQRTESADGERAQRIGSACDHGIGDAGVQQPCRGRQRLRTGRAGGRQRIGGAARAKLRGDKGRRRTELLLGVVECVRPAALCQARAHGVPALADAGGAGAKDHGDAPRAEAARHGLGLRPDLRQCLQQHRVAMGPLRRGHICRKRRRRWQAADMHWPAGREAIGHLASVWSVVTPQRGADIAAAVAECAQHAHRVQINRWRCMPGHHCDVSPPASVRIVSA